jgi:hypothetical protein
VHFRNIKGRKLDFMEAFPDEGDMDMPRALAAYRDVGYPYMLMPDHVPQIDGRDLVGVAFAYCYSHIQALIDALVPRPDRVTGYPRDDIDHRQLARARRPRRLPVRCGALQERPPVISVFCGLGIPRPSVGGFANL